MKKLIREWKRGVSYLFGDALISFYTFFTVIFAECAYLWAFHEETLAIPFTAVLLGYVLNVIVCAWFKGNWEETRIEVAFTIIYVAVFAVLFAIGCRINSKMAIAMTAIPFIITALWIGIREFQICIFVGANKVVMFISRIFANKIFCLFSQIFIIGAPLTAFNICLVQIPTLHAIWKIIIPIVYASCIPFIALYEDDSAALNIFELLYELTWSRHYEEYVRKPIQKMKDEDK